jgi:hypothetical protein
VCAAAYSGYVTCMTTVTLDVPALVAEVAEHEDGRSALQAALTAAAVEHVRQHHPDQVADVVSRVVAEIDRDVLAGFHGA